MPTDGARYAIGDLAGLAGSTLRTIRYYVAQGLLPPPDGLGAGAHYTDAHLARLRLIRRLQRQHQPLSEIRQRLASLADAEVHALVADDADDQAPPDSALEYLRTILGGSSAAQVAEDRAGYAAPSPNLSAPARLRSGAEPVLSRRMVSEPPAPVAPRMSIPATPATPDIRPDPEPAVSEQRSQWDRIAITPNIEIHVRRPLGRLENKRVERLITIARQLLREEQP
jgi:DNA-binding transcriptional MerR regulator